jgi:hypothetical protein
LAAVSLSNVMTLLVLLASTWKPLVRITAGGRVADGDIGIVFDLDTAMVLTGRDAVDHGHGVHAGGFDQNAVPGGVADDGILHEEHGAEIGRLEIDAVLGEAGDGAGLDDHGGSANNLDAVQTGADAVDIQSAQDDDIACPGVDDDAIGSSDQDTGVGTAAVDGVRRGDGEGAESTRVQGIDFAPRRGFADRPGKGLVGSRSDTRIGIIADSRHPGPGCAVTLSAMARIEGRRAAGVVAELVVAERKQVAAAGRGKSFAPVADRCYVAEGDVGVAAVGADTILLVLAGQVAAEVHARGTGGGDGLVAILGVAGGHAVGNRHIGPVLGLETEQAVQPEDLIECCAGRHSIGLHEQGAAGAVEDLGIVHEQFAAAGGRYPVDADAAEALNGAVFDMNFPGREDADGIDSGAAESLKLQVT